VQHVADGNHDVEGIRKAIEAAKAVTDKPSMIKITTTIGYGSPNKANTAGVHGAALGAEEATLTRKALDWTYGDFEVPAEAYDHWRQAIERGAAAEAEWNGVLEAYRAAYPTEAAEFERRLRGELPQGWDAKLPSFSPEDKGLATRMHSYNALNAFGPSLPELIGGSADLTHSNLTDIKGEKSFQKGAEANRYLHFGVREHAMAAILNGIAYHDSGLIPYGGTFLVFAGYMIGAIRLSALSELGVIYVLTHDSIGLGEDGPTHQPVETLANLRAIPNLLVIRPGDGNETVGAYQVAVANRKRPTVLALSRQAMANQANSAAAAVAKGGYVLEDSNGTPDLILIGTGTELELATKAAAVLRAEGRNVRVVSMPCVELFEEQDAAYRESVLPAAVRKRVVVEASSSFGWHKYSGFDGATVSIDRFGASAPGPVCLEKFGFTVDNVVAKAKALG
jgi:transketolase